MSHLHKSRQQRACPTRGKVQSKIIISLAAVLALAILSFPPRAVTQESEQDMEHEFWERNRRVVYTAAAAAAADFWTTRRNISRGAVERNPLARPFAESDAMFAGYKVASVAGFTTLSYVFHRRGWHKAERILPLIGITADVTAVGLNLNFRF